MEELLQYRNRVLRYVKKHVGMTTPDWEDVASEVMLSAVRAFQDFRHEASFSTYVYKIQKGKINDYFRKQYREREQQKKMNSAMIPFVLKNILTPATLFEKREIAELMARLTKGLPPYLARVVQLIDLEGKSGKEAASILNISIKTAYYYHHEARKRIRARLKRIGFFDEPQFSVTDLCEWIDKFATAYFRLCDRVGTTVEIKVEARKAKEAIEEILKENGVIRKKNDN